MNRIVLIGNGFDLAHGLKTRYEDFINWYLDHRTDNSGILYTEKIRDYDISIDYTDMGLIHKTMREYSPFLKTILKRVATKGWVDIENEYYALLIQNSQNLHSRPFDSQIVVEPQKLNIQLDHLKYMLIEYLKIEVEKRKTELIQSIKEKIFRPIIKKEIAVANYSNISHSEYAPEHIMLLNFNYTQTEHHYYDSCSNLQVNHIHGSLNDVSGVIFGYGDELDSGFEMLKSMKNNEYLRNMKSIRYLEADNYRKMLDFIELGPFQICIMGHSCGNSDRTLLNTLFEHRFCISVKPYYYQKKDKTDNYLELVQNISRNFTDMKLMRDRVVNKTYCEPLVSQ